MKIDHERLVAILAENIESSHSNGYWAETSRLSDGEVVAEMLEQGALCEVLEAEGLTESDEEYEEGLIADVALAMPEARAAVAHLTGEAAR